MIVLTFITITLYNNNVSETAYELRWEPVQQSLKQSVYNFLCELCNNKNASLISINYLNYYYEAYEIFVKQN